MPNISMLQALEWTFLCSFKFFLVQFQWIIHRRKIFSNLSKGNDKSNNIFNIRVNIIFLSEWYSVLNFTLPSDLRLLCLIWIFQPYLPLISGISACHPEPTLNALDLGSDTTLTASYLTNDQMLYIPHEIPLRLWLQPSSCWRSMIYKNMKNFIKTKISLFI